MVAHMRIANWSSSYLQHIRIKFWQTEVLSRVKSIKPFEQRSMRVGFGARWDQEKQPGFFMDMIQHWKKVQDPS
jgi:hypothetical protein